MRFIIILITFALLSYQVTGKNRIILTGKISGVNVGNFIVFLPILSYYNLNNEISSINVPVDKRGEFKTILTIPEKYGYLTLSINNRNIYLLFDSNDTITINVAFSKEDNANWLRIRGHNETGQLMLNHFLWQTLQNYDDINNFFAANNATDKNPIAFLRLDLLSKTKFLDSLYAIKQISKYFLNLSKKTIFAGQANEFLKPFLRPSKLYKIYSDKTINQYIDSVFTLVNPLDEDIMRSFNGDLYIDSYFQNLDKKTRNYIDIFQLKDSAILIGNTRTNLSNNFTPFLYIKDKRRQEYLWGSMLYAIKNIFPESLTVDDISTFTFFFPHSVFLKQTETTLEGIENNYDTSSNIKIDTSGTYKTLQELVSLKDKADLFYVDLWATWCSPCKREFKYNHQLDSFFQGKNIKRFYISLDDREVKATWLKDIYFFNLMGINLRADESLKQDILKQIFNNQASYSIPRYFIINEKGEILINDAPRPSDPTLISLFNKLLPP